MELDFRNAHVVVTGATGALGQAVVQMLIEASATCHVPVRNAESLARFPMARHSSVSVSIDVDLTDEPSVQSFFEGLPELWASVHCAGGFAMSPLDRTGAQDFQRMMSMNAWTCLLSCREAVKKIRSSSGGQEGGRIVNVAARPALEPRTGQGMIAYTASKAAVAAITQALAQEVASEGIWVNAVVPSIMDTEANREAMPDADHDQWARVEEVAATIAFLASPQNTSTRGGLVPVYGKS